MRVVITGGTGFIGSILTAKLRESGHDVIILTRKPSFEQNGVQYVQWLTDNASPENELGQVDAVVNLAGVSINDGRWTIERKNKSTIAESQLLKRCCVFCGHCLKSQVY